MLLSQLRQSPSADFLRGLGTFRDNPFLLFMSRRDLRNPKVLVGLTVYAAVLALAAWAALWVGGRWPGVLRFLFPAEPSPGIFASAIVTTVEFWFVVAWARRVRFALGTALERQAMSDYTLLPLTPAFRGGQQRTYPALFAMALILVALPVQVAASIGGGGGLTVWLATQAFILVCSIWWFDDAAQTTAWERMKAKGVSPSQASKRQRAGFIPLLVNLPQLAGHLARTRYGGQATGWVLFFPFVLPAWLLSARSAWDWAIPPALCLLCAMPFSIAVRERVAARALHRRAETVRIPPWAFGLTSTVLGLTVLLGFLWPMIRSGAPARALAIGNDPSRAAEGMVAILMLLWAVLAGALQRAPSSVTWGPLRSPQEYTDPLPRRTAWWHEVAWAIEAALSVYVPVTALALAWLIGSNVPWPSLGAVAPTIAAAAAICAAGWGLQRMGEWFQRTMRPRAGGLLYGVYSFVTLAAIALPPPYGRYLLAFHPFTAALGLVPWFRAWIQRVVPFAVGDLPEPAVSLPAMLAVAALGVVLGSRSWDAWRARFVTAPEPKRGEWGSVAPNYTRISLMERLTANPIPLRLTRSNGATTPEQAFWLSIVAAGAVYVGWLWCLGLTIVSPAPGPAVRFFTENPWPLAFAATATILTSIGVLSTGGATALRLERAAGTFGVLCLTPMSDREVIDGYLLRPRAMGLATVPALVALAPLLFVGTPALAVGLSLVALGVLTYPGWVALTRLSVAEALPPLSATGARAMRFWDQLFATVAGLFLLAQACAILALPFILAFGNPAERATRALWASAILVGCLVFTSLIAWWGERRMRRRFRDIRQLAIPEGPDQKLADALRASGWQMGGK